MNTHAMIKGSILIGGGEVRNADIFFATDSARGVVLEPAFSSAGLAEVDEACALADGAFESFSEASPEERACFLDTIAMEIEALGDTLIDRGMQETGLSRGRLEGERARTTSQLKLFSSFVRKGGWVHATIDRALPDRQPQPRPDLRRRHVAIGPVAVFGASNFPLAFSVAGGDTASAFAAGCPVIVKGHPAHPGTGEWVAQAIRSAVKICKLHQGVFSYLPGSGNALGAHLAADPRIKAVGFTGSRAGGLALVGIAATRPEPIPVYAEMSSVNPVILFPGALAKRADTLAVSFIQSLTIGAGQFCTNPGLLVAIDGPGMDRFVDYAATALGKINAQTMLTEGISAKFQKDVEHLRGHADILAVGEGRPIDGPNQGRGALFHTSARSFLADASLANEVFGPSAIIVAARDLGEVRQVIAALEGQLTATLLVEPEDEALAALLVPALSRKVGRIIANGWPTGVEVSHAMVHGGPFPATSDSRATSVGTLAIERFLRPLCYQDMPEGLLPEALRDGNPLGIPR